MRIFSRAPLASGWAASALLAMSGVGHDPAAHFERHRRTQREERERRAALAAAGVADAAAYENPNDARRLDFGTTGVLEPVGSMRDVKCRVAARLASLQ